jgi:hypothetical protein
MRCEWMVKPIQLKNFSAARSRRGTYIAVQQRLRYFAPATGSSREIT